MAFASKLVSDLFNKDLSNGYAVLFLVFILICILSVLGGIYYATRKKAIHELGDVTWLSFKDTVKYSAITIISLILCSSILFVYDFSLDKVVNLIIQNAK